MPRYSAPINSQRMNAPLAILGPPNPLPLLNISAILTEAVEGTTLSYLVSRTRNSGGSLTFNYLVTSTGDGGHFPADQPLDVNVTVGPDVLTYTIQIKTLDRDGLQGERLIIVNIAAVSGCEVDPARKSASTNLLDNPEDPDDPNWFKTLPYTSGKALALGTSYFTDWRTYTTECNDVDSFHGDHFGTDNAYVQTWDQVQGGPLLNPASILDNGQLGWNNNVTTFSKPFREVPVNTAWVFHNFTVVPFAARTDSGVTAARRAIWDEIIAGTHDQRFIDFGARIALLFAARGINLKYYIGCMCPKPQTASVYRIYADTRLLFKAACDRVYAKMREGSGAPNLRFCFAPTHLRTYEGENYGALADWAPDTCDAIGIAFHPNSFCTNQTRYNTLMNGNANYYGVIGDAHALSVARELPLAIFEWSPRFETCPIANDVYGWFYNDFLVPNAPVLVAANIFSEQTFNPDAADAQGTGPAAQWELGVNTFKTLFGDPTVVPEAVVRVEATAVGKVTEGNTLTFNVKRNVPVTKACSVRWTATSSRASADLTGSTTGLISFTAAEATLSKSFDVKTADLSATVQGDRTITVTLSAPVTCSIDPTKAQASTVIQDFIAGVVDTAFIYKNPFNKDAAHHRPIGKGLIYQVQGSVAQRVGGPIASSPYRANPGPVYKSGDISPLVEVKAGLNHSGFFGEINAGGGGSQGIKYYYYVPNDALQQNVRTVKVSGVNTSVTFPTDDFLSGPTVKPIIYPTGSGDNVVCLYTKNGSSAITAAFIFMTKFVNSATPTCTRLDEWPIDKLDYDIGNRASGGSGVRFPTMITRGLNMRKSPPYFGHSLQMVVPRHSGASPGDAKLSIIQMSDGNVWPSVSQDSGADDPDRPIGTVVNPGTPDEYTLQFGDQPNSGWIPYGQLFVIPKWFWGLRDSKPGNTVTIPEYPGITWSLNLSDIGLALFDALCDYGIRAIDGNGQGVVGPEGKAYGRFELRIDQDCVSVVDGPALAIELDAELNKICPPISGGATKWKQNLLFPVAGIRPYSGETERHEVATGGDGLCYVGGGGRGRVFPNCVNTAYDAGGGGGGGDYSYVADITLPIWSAGAGSVTNFLLPFKFTHDDLKHASNGGKVQNASGFDIIFQTAAGAAIPHKDVRYNGTTGYVVKLLNLPRNFAAAQTIKIYIGNAKITASQQDVAGTRAGGWEAIYFGNGIDLTGNNRNLTARGTPVAGFLNGWPAQTLGASGSDYYSTPGSTTWLDSKAALSAICYSDVSRPAGKKSEFFNVASDTNVTALSLHHNDSTPATNRYTFIIKFGTATALQYQSQDNSASAKAIAVVAQSSTAIKMAGDGAMFTAGQAATPGATSTSITNDLEWGRGSRGDLDACEGSISFLGFCSAALSNSTIESTTAVLKDPSLVYTVGPFVSLGDNEFVSVAPIVAFNTDRVQIVPTATQLKNRKPVNADADYTNFIDAAISTFGNVEKETLDLRDIKFYHHSLVRTDTANDKNRPGQKSCLRVRGWKTELTIVGGEFIGEQAVDTLWDKMKTLNEESMDDQGILFDSAPNSAVVNIENCVFRGQFDGISPFPSGNSVTTTIRGCYAENQRDEFIEADNGDDLLRIYDCLVDSTHNFLSVRPGGGNPYKGYNGTPRERWVIVRNVLARCRGQYYGRSLGIQPADRLKVGDKRIPQWAPGRGDGDIVTTAEFNATPPDGPPGYVSRETFKGLGSETVGLGDGISTLWIDCKDCLFAFEGKSTGGDFVFPPGEYVNTYLLYLPGFTTAFPKSFWIDSRYVDDRGIIVKDGDEAQEIWDTARAAWITAHGGTIRTDPIRGDVWDFPFLHKPT